MPIKVFSTLQNVFVKIQEYVLVCVMFIWDLLKKNQLVVVNQRLVSKDTIAYAV